MEVYGDEEMFTGLACPPLEDFAFNFVSDDDAAMNFDIFFDDQEEDESDQCIPIGLKRRRQPPPPPRNGKELKRVVQVLKPTHDQLNWIAKCLKESQAEAVDPILSAAQKGKGEAINLTTKGQEEYWNKKVLDESSIQLKFESTKRKLYDSYQRIEDAKKQKKIQLIEFQKPMPKAIKSSMKKSCKSIAIPQY